MGLKDNLGALARGGEGTPACPSSQEEEESQRGSEREGGCRVEGFGTCSPWLCGLEDQKGLFSFAVVLGIYHFSTFSALCRESRSV